jgi:hypothetical protein
MFQIRLQKVKNRIEMPLNKMKIINYESNIVSILSILMVLLSHSFQNLEIYCEAPKQNQIHPNRIQTI